VSPLQRIILINLVWRFGIQLPAFTLYRALARPK
jgi:hypothetical protein